MKMQKVEIEVPKFYGYDFVGHRSLIIPNDNDLYVLIEHGEGEYSIKQVELLNSRLDCSRLDCKFFLYKKKRPRKIIYEEVREDYLKRGDLYLDDNGDVNEWVFREQSRDKNIILKKIHDDFEVNNG